MIVPEIINTEVLEKTRTQIKIKIKAAAESFEAALEEAKNDTETASKLLIQAVWEKLINTDIEGKTLLIAKDWEVLNAKSGENFEVIFTCLTPVDVQLKTDFRKVKVQMERPVVSAEESKDAAEREKIYKSKYDAAVGRAEDEVMRLLAAQADMEVDNLFIEEEITRNLNAFERELSQHGMNLDSFLQMSGKEIRQFREELKPAAQQSIKIKGVIDRISILENITVTEDEIEAYIKEKAEESAVIYELEVEYLIDFGRKNKNAIIKEMVYHKTLDLIRDTCIEIVEKKQS